MFPEVSANASEVFADFFQAHVKFAADSERNPRRRSNAQHHFDMA